MRKNGEQTGQTKKVAKHAKLPSILDSKIWKVRCLRGQERQLTV